MIQCRYTIQNNYGSIYILGGEFWQCKINREHGLPWRKHTSITVILSQPVPIRASGAKQQFKSSSQISSGCIVQFDASPSPSFACAKRVLMN